MSENSRGYKHNISLFFSRGVFVKKIFLVDDDNIHLSIAATILQEKYEITAVKSGHEALMEIVKGNIPDLVLLDIVMAGMDGWETYMNLKGIALLRDIPIAFLTSSDAKEDREYARKLGSADYITKPYHGADLLKRVEAMLKKVA